MARSIRLLIIVGTLSVWMLGPAPFASAQRACRETKVTAFDGGVFQMFGYSVAVSGDTAMIGADWDDDLGTQSGSAYVYQREPDPEGSWVFAQKLLGSDEVNGDEFGHSVAIDGDVAFIGALQHIHEGAPGTGSVYVFRFDPDTASWIEEEELLASMGTWGDGFGFSVSISGDVALIGAVLDDDNGGNSGSAYVFRYDAKMRMWIEEQKLLASDGAAGDFFGDAVAIVADPAGDVALIGAGGHDDLGNNAGAAYVFRYDPKTSTWQEEQKLLASDGATSDQFAFAAVSLSGIQGEAAAVIGAHRNGSGTAYVFRYDPKNSTWFEEQKLSPSGGAPDDFGRAAAIDGDIALIGSFKASAVGTNSGAAYVYRYDPDTSQWSQADMLVPDPGPWAASFGWSVALDGDRAVCGAHGENQQAGAAYMFAGLQGIDCNNNGLSDSCEQMDPDACPWDLDDNEIVGASDLLSLLVAWGTAPCGPPDFDNDGNVGASDLLALLVNWGPCP
ncbi:MAG: FG-GAP repeat protein [Phycisphaerales bacterium]